MVISGTFKRAKSVVRGVKIPTITACQFECKDKCGVFKAVDGMWDTNIGPTTTGQKHLQIQYYLSFRTN